jgi:hypothetical protein
MTDLQKALQTLLEQLLKISEEYGELFDTEVREQMREAVHNSFVEPTSGYVLPETFGMFEAEANQAVKAALQQYADTMKPLTDAQNLSAQQRLEAFEDATVMVGGDLTPDEFFGWRGKL